MNTLKSLAWTSVELWFNKFVSVTLFLYLARLLGPETYGTFALMSALLVIGMTLVEQGYIEYIIRYDGSSDEVVHLVFWMVFATSFGVLAVVAICLNIVSHFGYRKN